MFLPLGWNEGPHHTGPFRIGSDTPDLYVSVLESVSMLCLNRPHLRTLVVVFGGFFSSPQTEYSSNLQMNPFRFHCIIHTRLCLSSCSDGLFALVKLGSAVPSYSSFTPLLIIAEVLCIYLFFFKIELCF